LTVITGPELLRRYRTIVADPPWPYNGVGPVGCIKKDGTPSIQVGSEGLYGAMAVEAICALRPLAEDDAHLYLWTTNAFMVEAHEVAEAWGFKPKTILTWTKTHRGDPSRVSMKTGYYFRGATEHVVFAVRGSLPLRVSEGLPTGYLWPRLPHSVKPDAFFDLVERASPGPYLELFARRKRPSWDAWGDEVESDVTVGSGDG
jgi:N6-adenosine-specific RNA methylase IME4